jgi:hypothetical protein
MLYCCQVVRILQAPRTTGARATTGEFGNLTNINAASSAYTGCTQESLSVTTNTTLNNNQITSFSYDASGTS